MKIPPKPDEMDAASKQYKVHKKHYWLHLASGVFVFCLGIGADILIGELRHRWPHKVRWMSNQVTDGHRLSWVSDTNFWNTGPANVDIGFCDDGTLCWRREPATNASTVTHQGKTTP